ncbi:MAG: hypothetical protein IJO78_06450 [Erysipelotrichaceae bacterium]|nr:hypothetical protein [Erysipelotrichaceae bacterium]
MINILLCNLLMVICLWWFSQSLMSRKYHHYVHEILVFVMLCVSSYCGFVWLRVLLVIVVCTWYVCSKYIADKQFQMLVLCVYFGCISLCEWLCASVFCQLEGLRMYDYGTGLYTLLLCFTFLMLFILLYMAYQMLYVYKKKCWMKHMWMVCVLPVCSLVLFLNMKDLFLMFVFDELVIVALVGIFFANLIVLFLYRQMVELYMLKQEYAFLDDKYHSLHDLYASNCSFLHEVTRKIFKLKNDDSELHTGLDELCCVLFQQFYNTQTDCIPLRNVLVKYQKKLREWQIDVHSDMQIWHSSFCEELFTNLVEYGIAACTSVDGIRSMMFSSYHLYNVDVLKCVFSCNDEYDVDVPFENLYSRRFVDGFCELTFVL